MFENDKIYRPSVAQRGLAASDMSIFSQSTTFQWQVGRIIEAILKTAQLFRIGSEPLVILAVMRQFSFTDSSWSICVSHTVCDWSAWRFALSMSHFCRKIVRK